jgi:hypothetical protein
MKRAKGEHKVRPNGFASTAGGWRKKYITNRNQATCEWYRCNRRMAAGGTSRSSLSYFKVKALEITAEVKILTRGGE